MNITFKLYASLAEHLPQQVMFIGTLECYLLHSCLRPMEKG